MTLVPTMGLAFDAETAVVVAAGFTVSDRVELVDAACPDPLAGLKVAVSASGEPLAGKDVEQVAVPVTPLTVSGWLVQPEIAAALPEKATVPVGAGAPVPVVVTVAVSVTVWLVLEGDGFGVASVVVVGVTAPRTVAVTLLAV
jgi:hypothetical protein